MCHARAAVIGALLLVFVVIAAAALLVPVASDAGRIMTLDFRGRDARRRRGGVGASDRRFPGASDVSDDRYCRDARHRLDPRRRGSSTRCVADPAHAPKMTKREMATVTNTAGAFGGATWRDGEARYLGGRRATGAFGTRAFLTHTVEHAPEWCGEISSWDEMKCMRDSGRGSSSATTPGSP